MGTDAFVSASEIILTIPWLALSRPQYHLPGTWISGDASYKGKKLKRFPQTLPTSMPLI